MQRSALEPIRVSFVGTYPPRRCGIATFTQDLASQVTRIQEQKFDAGGTVQVVALTNVPQGYHYAKDVRFEIRTERRRDYHGAANFLNLSDIDVICLQHEFAIFGGKNGAYIIDLLASSRKPLVSTLHTVLKKPTKGQLEVMRSICSYSTYVVVQSQKAIDLLMSVYDVPRQKIVMIHHGTPDIPLLDSGHYKDQFHAKGRQVILTFGLLGPKKGIEVVIEAIALIIQEFPHLLYIVVGATHPEVKRRLGEEYREFLKKLVREKGLTENVVFYNRFVSLEHLIGFLQATDIYVAPYLSEEQIVSGTLAYAVACGKAVISTPSWYAEELLSNNRGKLVPFGDPNDLASQLTELLNDEIQLNSLQKRAYQFGRQMIWPKVAHAYIEAFQRALKEYRRPGLEFRSGQWITGPSSPPEIKLDYLRLLTDDTGIIQHATFATPDRSHGYCTDDNARALIVTIINYKLFQEKDVLCLLQIYLSFLNHALDKDSGCIRNMMSYDRHWLEKAGPEDSYGRTLWSLGTAILYPPTDSILAVCRRLFDRILPASESFTSPRAWAYSILGCLAYLQRFKSHAQVQRFCTLLAQRLSKLFMDNGSTDWQWAENIITYDNGRLVQALLAAGRMFKKRDMCKQGLNSLEWLLRIQTNMEEGHLSLIGNSGWFKFGGTKAQFDQQPIEVPALIDACYEAYLLTGQSTWIERTNWCFDWFLGRNDVHEVLYDFITDGCRDGLQPTGVNQNQGAESTLAWLMALHRVYEIVQQQDRLLRRKRKPDS